MKFAKELEESLVAEWKTRYFNYKQGKKKIKAITAALRNANRTGRTPTFLGRSPRTPSRNELLGNGSSGPASSANTSDVENVPHGQGQRRSSEPLPEVTDTEYQQQTRPLPIKGVHHNNSDQRPQHLTRYGSIVGTPPDQPLARTESLDLGDPALDLDRRLTREAQLDSSSIHSRTASMSHEQPQPKASHQKHPHWGSISAAKKSAADGLFSMRPRFPHSRSHDAPLYRRMMNRYKGHHITTPIADIPLEARADVNKKYEEFLAFLDSELGKIEDFYMAREDYATSRLDILRSQLHLLRDQRGYEIYKLKEAKAYKLTHAEQAIDDDSDKATTKPPSTVGDVLRKPLESFKAARRLGTKHPNHIRPTYLATPPSAFTTNESRRDYQKRPPGTAHVEYRKAKRKLKTALQEYYRGLELLKSYGESNRTAFRKINKKFDKTFHTEKKLRYYNDKVISAHFVKSDVIERNLKDVEDLYGRYFENGNRKAAERKLRSRTHGEGDFTNSMFWNGLMIGVGTTFGIYGLVLGTNILLHDPDASIRLTTSYLLQIYAGFFLMLFMSLLFILACWFMMANKINFPFIFEFDTRHMLNWRQLLGIPLAFYLLLGLTMWLNFDRVGGDAMYIYWPVVLIGLAFVTLFFPAPIIYHNTRLWFLHSIWRLFFSSIYPVEFRDFFLGDLFCSLTYSMGNIELFFCLYAHHWMNPAQCNSSSSRLLGFFTTLPGIWRALQCIRRFKDTGALFPHMANCGKYVCTILYYAMLSLYRMNHSVHYQALFIVFAAINGIYTTIWDLLIDWSLGSTTSKHILLRDELPYKRPRYYYAAMVIDVIVRQNWIFYAIFAHDVQHSAVLSFFVALSEVFRRGVWILFRVENEHTSNILSYRAYKDKPLPYPINDGTAAPAHSRPDGTIVEEDESYSDTAAVVTTTGADPVIGSPSLRRRQTPKISPSLRRAGAIIRGAHAQDYERKKPTDEDEAAEDDEDEDDDDDDDDDDAYVEDEAEHEAEDQVEAEQATNSSRL